MASLPLPFAAFLAGLLSFVSPCVLPLVPPYLVYLAGTSLERLEQLVSSSSAPGSRSRFPTCRRRRCSASARRPGTR